MYEEGVNRDPLVKEKIDLYRKVIVAQSLVDNEIDKAAKKYYDNNPEEFKKLRLSQIEIKFAPKEEAKEEAAERKEEKNFCVLCPGAHAPGKWTTAPPGLSREAGFIGAKQKHGNRKTNPDARTGAAGRSW
jgi:uncharacterized protein (DUF169 family)